MKLSEIFLAGQRYRDVTDDELNSVQNYVDSNASKVVPIEAGRYAIKLTPDGSYSLTRSSGEVMGWVKFSNKTIAGQSYAALNVVYIRKELRGSPAFFILLNAVRNLLAKPILVDGAIFVDGERALAAMSRREAFKVMVIDVHTGVTSPYTGEVPLDRNKAIVVEGFDFPLGQSTWVVPGAMVTEWVSYSFFDAV